MKTWITYLTSLFLALATALLLGDTTWILPVLSSLNSLAVNTGLLLALVMTVFSLPGAIASLRKDRAGGKLVSTSVAWALVTSVLLPLFTALISSALPVVFPVSTTAGSGTIAPQYVTNVFQSAYQATFSGNLALILSVSDSFLLPVVILAFIIGLALKPSADVIKPAYITINSFSEVMFRIARALNYFGYIFAYFTFSAVCAVCSPFRTIYSSFSSFRHLGQTFLPLNTVMSLVASQKMQLGLYFFRMTDEPST